MDCSQHLSETVSLFTDEKTANSTARVTFIKVVEWFNEIPTADPQKKCQLLVKIQETIMSSCVELLEEFLEYILALAHDTNMEVRKQVVAFMQQIWYVSIKEGKFLGQIVSTISMLLSDRSPHVIKRVIQASGSIYKNGLQWISSQQELTDSCEQTWKIMGLIKAQILDLIDSENDGISTNAIKFLEGVVILQSYPNEDSQKKDNDFSLKNIPDNHKIIKRQKLAEESSTIFEILLQFHAAEYISSVNLIVCTGSLCTIAKLRPCLMGPVIKAFESLNSNLPPTLTHSQVRSVRKTLKMQLKILLKNKGSYEYQSVIRHLLLDLGSSQGEVQSAIPKMDEQEQMRKQKRMLENATSSLAKRMCLSKANDEEELEKPPPIRNLSVPQQVSKNVNLFGQQLTDQILDPGSAVFTKELPMKSLRKDEQKFIDDDNMEVDGIQSENLPDLRGYNGMLSQIIDLIIEREWELEDKIAFLRKVYLEATSLNDGSLKPLFELILKVEYTAHSLELLKDLAILRPPGEAKYLRHLLNFSVHEIVDIREKALEHIIALYYSHPLLSSRSIDEFALEWASHLEKEYPPVTIYSNEYGRPNPETAWREENIKICLTVLLALIPHKPEIYLQKLTQIYRSTTTTADLKRAIILRSLDSPTKMLGPDNAHLLKLIEESPKGCETLIIRIIYILTENQLIPHVDLVDRVKQLFETKIKDVRVLIPILGGLSGQDILNVLPELIQLDQFTVKEVFNRILTKAIAPADILIALHTIDIKECDLKCIENAISFCLAEKEVFTQDVLVYVLEKLVEFVPTPTLLMRTILKTLNLDPYMSKFIIYLLQRLVQKQVWRQQVIWEGFLESIQWLVPASFPVMLHLPPKWLMIALEKCPDLRQPLYEFAESIQDNQRSAGIITPQIMNIIRGFISVENIKKHVTTRKFTHNRKSGNGYHSRWNSTTAFRRRF